MYVMIIFSGPVKHAFFFEILKNLSKILITEFFVRIYRQFKRSANKMIDEDTKIIPGHGPLTDKSELYRLHTMLTDTIEIVKVKKQAGKSLEQIQAEGLPPKYADWGQGYMNAEGWIAMIHESIDTKEGMSVQRHE